MSSDERKERLAAEPKEELTISRRRLIAERVSWLLLGVVGTVGVAAAIQFDSGDTPVVLIGGSVTVKASHKVAGKKWRPSGNGYAAPLGRPIEWIAVKKDSSDDYGDGHKDDDDNSSSDLGTPTPVPNKAKSWEVDLYTLDAGGVVSAGPKLHWDDPSSEIFLDNNGVQPCPGAGSRRIAYCKNGNQLSFSRVTVITTDQNGVIKETLVPCADSSGAVTHHCRIVIRYPWHILP